MAKKFADWNSVVERYDENIIKPNISNSFSLDTGDKVFTIGSCFARNIEEYLDVLGFNVPTLQFIAPYSESPNRPNGILNKYTPSAIFEELNWAVEVIKKPESFAKSIEPFKFEDKNGVIDLQLGHHYVSNERFEERRSQLLELWKNALDSDCVTLTLGLTERWVDTATGLSISSAPSVRSMLRERGRFKFSPLSFSESFSLVSSVISLIRSVSPDTKFLITTSPVPLQKTFRDNDVLIANQASKSKLRAVCDEVVEQFDNVDYFPSYEMISFGSPKIPFGKDLRHVRDNAVGEVISLLSEHYFSGVDEFRVNLQKSLKELSAKQKNTPAMESVLSDLPIGELSAKDALLCSRIAWRCNKRYLSKELLLRYFDVSEPNARDLKALAYVANKCKETQKFKAYLGQVLLSDPSNKRALSYLEEL
ncbi:GSCFA domain-containing protein [Alteromonas australica]|uniref:GSCFA domain-containing protein n=1 Tax=Alteromonas australica TaxID=589873 RepID=UPI00235268C3|nr:GSCFA domain-containing protein [Alteromonas australica]|tara:strand:- start:6441 stop:7706 length:1266 start_codon:yes stop_codon:yes gene_type:complete